MRRKDEGANRDRRPGQRGEMVIETVKKAIEDKEEKNG